MPIEGGMNGGNPQGPDLTAPAPAAATPPTPAPQPPPSPAPSPAPSLVTGPAPTPPAVPAPSGAGAAGTPPPAFVLRDYINNAIPGARDRYQSDEQLAAELLRVAMQAQQQSPFADLGQRMAPHAQKFQAWLAEQEAATRQQQQQQQAQWWQPPEYDPAWERGVARDAAGNLVALPGFPPDLPSRLQQARQWQQEKLTSFLKDPIGTLRDGLVPLIQQEATRLTEERLNQQQAHTFSQQYVDRGVNWLAQKDAQGNPLRDANGAYVLTPAGQRFAQVVNTLHQQGVSDPRVQADLAEKIVLGELAAAQFQRPGQQPAAAPGQPAPAPGQPAFAPLNNPNYAATPVAKPGQSLRDMMWEALENNGIATRPANSVAA